MEAHFFGAFLCRIYFNTFFEMTPQELCTPMEYNQGRGWAALIVLDDAACQ